MLVSSSVEEDGSSLLGQASHRLHGESSALLVLCVCALGHSPPSDRERLGLGSAQRARLGLEFGDELVERHHQEHALPGTAERRR